MSLVYLTDNQEFAIKAVVNTAAGSDHEGQKCWCGVTMAGPSQHGLHTPLCHQIREFMGIKEKGEPNGQAR